jgi:hypothetical protein
MKIYKNNKSCKKKTAKNYANMKFLFKFATANKTAR